MMTAVMVRYRVHPECAAENEALVCGVYEQLRSEQPEGLRYAAFVGEDGVSFTHVLFAELAEAAAALPRLEAFRRFRAGLDDRCAEAPVVTRLSEVGSVGFDPPDAAGGAA